MPPLSGLNLVPAAADAVYRLDRGQAAPAIRARLSQRYVGFSEAELDEVMSYARANVRASNYIQERVRRYYERHGLPYVRRYGEVPLGGTFRPAESRRLHGLTGAAGLVGLTVLVTARLASGELVTYSQTYNVGPGVSLADVVADVRAVAPTLTSRTTGRKYTVEEVYDAVLIGLTGPAHDEPSRTLA